MSSQILELRGQLIADGGACGCEGASLTSRQLSLRCGATSFDGVVSTDNAVQIQTPGAIGQAWVQVPVTDSLEAVEFLYLQSNSPVRLRIGAAPASVLGVGGTFPTGFTGGEGLDVTIDTVAFTTTFTSGAQTAVQCAAAINAAAALAGFAYQPASVVGGQIQLQGLATGSQGSLEVTGGTGAADLGLDGLSGTGEGSDVDVYGLFLNEWGKSGAAPTRIDISGSARVMVMAAGTV